MDKNKDANEYRSKGLEFFYLRSGHPRSALYFTRAVHTNPYSTPLYLKLAEAQEKQRKYYQAVCTYKIAMTLDPYRKQIYLDCASILSNSLGQVDEAIKILERGIEFLPNESLIHNRYGCLLRLQERYDEAIAQYKIISELDSYDKNVYNNWGVTLYYQEKYDEAILKFEEATKKSKQSNYYFNWGLALQQQLKYEEAEEMYMTGLMLIPDLIHTKETLPGAIATELDSLEKKKSDAMKEEVKKHIQVTIDGMTKILKMAKELYSID